MRERIWNLVLQRDKHMLKWGLTTGDGFNGFN